jgi:hypothetical protein
LIGYELVQAPAGRANPRLWRKLRQLEALSPQAKHLLQLTDILAVRDGRMNRPGRGVPHLGCAAPL